ncbi:NAD-dependent epimerase/dehydratase family protein [Microbacterium sp. JZ31]|uniref:NAD-dependent epimerase/dehydratase family protein n=1 Tax=Microbacterium sp. JZ31 TaxID=1906274 RepID=UPI001934587E|nr:NAD-dependent epimerase/dehydratase family protein [Microbacterium sp. JZ31]
MRLLVLGGTVFLSRAVAEAALSRGHDVTTVSRGASGSPLEGARHVHADRDAPLPAELAGVEYDAVVDVSSRPSRVRSALAQLRAAHWVYVSSISVYADEATVGGAPGMLPQHEPLDEDSDDMADYGRLKAGCERLVGERAQSRAIVRPGLIVGPGDRSGRFTYWVDRMRRASDGEIVLAPGDPSDRVQLIDVRDLGAWIALLAERRTAGVFDAIGEPASIRDVLDDVAAGCGALPRWRWATDEQLEGVEVSPWMGPRSLPLWLPRPAYDGMMTHLAAPAFQAGLRTRPVADTARDTLAWLETADDPALTGLTADEEREVLAAFG